MNTISNPERNLVVKNLEAPDDLLLIKELMEEAETDEDQQARADRLELVDVNYVYECVAGKQYIVQIKTYCCPIRQTSRRKATGRSC